MVDTDINRDLVDLYAPGAKYTILTIKSSELDRLAKEEIDKGIFYARFDGRLQLLPVVTGAQTPHGSPDSATAFDLALIPELRDLLPKAAGNWYYTYMVGQLFMGRNPKKAEYYLRQAIALEGGVNSYPYFHLVQLFHSEGDYAQALTNYQLAYDHDNPAARNPGFAAAINAMKAALAGKVH